MPLFDVIVPTYNNVEGLKRCLDSLFKQTFLDYRILVCVDGSKDGTMEYLQQLSSGNPKILVLEHPDKSNKGRAKNRNQAIGIVNADFVLFIDGDVICDTLLLEKHLNLLNNNPECISIGFTDWTNQETNLWAYYISRRGIGKHEDLDVVPYQYFITQNTAMKSQYFIDLAGFDPKFITYGGEDTEFAFRLKEKYNPSFILNKQAKVSSESDKSLEKALDLLETFGRENLSYIATKHPNCQDIFYLGLLHSKNLKARTFKFILQPIIYMACLALAITLPYFCTAPFINYCVAYRIKKGFLQDPIS